MYLISTLGLANFSRVHLLILQGQLQVNTVLYLADNYCHFSGSQGNLRI